MTQTRLERALEARKVLNDDFFGGWEPEDVDLFEKYRITCEPKTGYITGFLGMAIKSDYVPWASSYAGKQILSLPIPDDSVKAEAIEYFSLIHSLENTQGDSFSMAELGASYGPWAVEAAILSKRKKKKFRAVVVEASSFMFNLIEQHFANNDLPIKSSEDFSIKLIHAAVALKKSTMFFPEVTNAGENGGQASVKNKEIDYVGREIQHEKVQGLRLKDIFSDGRKLDYLHMDIQGAEAEIIIKNIRFFNKKVKHLFVGTHSRAIEGIIFETLRKEGWICLRERPCVFKFRTDLDNLAGMTLRDGGQYWMNPRNI